MIALLAANEPVTPTLFFVAIVIWLVKMTIDLAGRTTPVWRSRRDRARARRSASPPPPPRPDWFDGFAKDYSRRTPPSYWLRMLADLTPLRPAEREKLITERERGVRHLAEFIDSDENNKDHSV